MINVMCIFIFVNWDTLVPRAYQLCCLPSINNTIQYNTMQIDLSLFYPDAENGEIRYDLFGETRTNV